MNISYNYLKSETSLKPIYADHLFNTGYTSNINIDGQPKTIKKVILYNDIVKIIGSSWKFHKYYE